MTPEDAARILGVTPTMPWEQVRQAYRDLIRTHHPDTAGPTGSTRATVIIEAYRVLSQARAQGAAMPGGATASSPPPPPPASAWADRPRPSGAVRVTRPDADTLVLQAPANEAFRWLLDAAHDVGEITYVDRSMPIMEVLCRFEDEPATSLLLTLQGRGLGTEVFCTVESIEDRPPPPTAAVVDLLELALHRRLNERH